MLFGTISPVAQARYHMLFDFVGRVNEFSFDQVKVIGTKSPRTGIGAVVKAGFQNHFSLRQVSQKLSFRNEGHTLGGRCIRNTARLDMYVSH